jgi:outer membrane protein TolC
MTGMIENNFTPISPQPPLMLAGNTSNYSDSSQLSASLSVNLIKGSYWSEGRFNDRKIEISRLTGRENFRAATIRAHIDAEQVYYDLIQKQIRLSISERALDTSKKIAADLKEMVEVGEADKISLLRSQQQIANSEIDLNTTRNDYQEAREKLRETLSMNAGEFEGLFPDAREILKIPPPPKMTKDQAIAAGLANRPDLKIQELALEQQGLDTRISGFNRLPNLDLSVSSSRSGAGQGFGQTTDNAWSSGPETVTWSLSTSYQLIGNTDFDTFRKARIALEKARINRDKVLNQVSKEITSSLERVRIAYIRLDHAKSNREISETKVSAEYEKFIVGESDNKNLIEAQNEVTQARISELQAYIEVRGALSFLQQAIGAEGR